MGLVLGPVCLAGLGHNRLLLRNRGRGRNLKVQELSDGFDAGPVGDACV